MALQGVFNRKGTFIVVRQTRLTSNSVLKIGTEVPSKEHPLKMFHLRSLFQRRAIGIKGSAWTEALLAGKVPIKVPEKGDNVVTAPEKKVKKTKAKKTDTKKTETKKEGTTDKPWQ